MMTLQTEQPGTYIRAFFWIKWVLSNAVGFPVSTDVPPALYCPPVSKIHAD